MTFAAGIMKSIHPGAEIKIQDRFFVGGPLTLRGFGLQGVGPSEDGIMFIIDYPLISPDGSAFIWTCPDNRKLYIHRARTKYLTKTFYYLKSWTTLFSQTTTLFTCV